MSAPYATVADAIALYGESYITVLCDRDDDGLPDTASLDRHFEIASSHMNGYLLGRYPLPLATPPSNFAKLCIDIALYNAAPSQDVRTDELRLRAEDATRYMELLAANKIRLEIAPDVPAPTNAVEISSVVAPASVRQGVRGFPPDVLKQVL